MQDQSNQMPQEQQVEIELPEDEAQGTYSNLVMVAHSPSEFILDFISVMPGTPKAKVAKRMVLTPDHAKRLANALNENVQKYEQEHGQISGNEKLEIPFNYRGPKPEA